MRLISRLVFCLLAIGLVHLAGQSLAQEKGKVKVGDKAPTFESIDDQGKAWKSADVVGKKILVLYFYPADMTGGCTKQACGFRDDIEKLNGKGVEVVGVSGDSAKNHQIFKKEHSLNFTLLADEKGDLAKAFGVPVNKGGKVSAKLKDGSVAELIRGASIARWTIVIDKAGKVAAIDTVKDAGGDSKRIAEIVKGIAGK